MKRLILVSLLLNIALLGMTWLRARREAPMPRLTRGEMTTSSSSFRRLPRSEASAAVAESPWGKIDSTDTRDFIANLRRLGCPEDTIRDLVVTRVCRDYRNRALAARMAQAQSWDFTKNRSQQDWREQRDFESRLRDEMRNELETLLGQPAGKLSTAILSWADRGDSEYLSLDKRREVREIQQRYRAEIQELRQRQYAGGLDADDRARLKELQQQETADLAAVLSPAEQEERFHRESETAGFVRQNLPPAQSEAEFRQIVKLAEEYGLADQPISVSLRLRYGMPGSETDSDVADYEQRKAAFDERLKAVLGEERIAEQQAAEAARQAAEHAQEQARSEQEAREMMRELAAAAGVEEATANQFFDRIKEMQTTLDTRLKALEESLTGTPEERRKQMDAAVKAELEQVAVEIMGEKGREFIQKIEEKQQGGR